MLLSNKPEENIEKPALQYAEIAWKIEKKILLVTDSLFVIEN